MSLKAVKAAWVAVSALVLAIALYGFDRRPDSDIGVFLVWSMLILAAPISIVVALLLTGVSIVVERLFSQVIPTTYWWIAISWLCFFAAGYWQWFALLTWLWRKWRKRTDGRPASSRS